MRKSTNRKHSGARKHGRNKVKCERYRYEHRREKNKLRCLKKLIIQNPNDKQMARVIKKLEEII